MEATRESPATRASSAPSAVAPPAAAARPAAGGAGVGSSSAGLASLAGRSAAEVTPVITHADDTRRSLEVLALPVPAGLTGLQRASSSPVDAVGLKGPRVLGHGVVLDLGRAAAGKLAAASTLSAIKPVVRLDRPAPVPGGPFTLTPFVVGLRCPAAELRSHMERALRTSNVDYEYNDAKWKAKCYVFKPGGHCHFVVRLYADRPGSGEDAFLLELQRRAGCTRIFHRTYDAVIASFSGLGVLHPEGEAAKRLATLSQRVAPAGSPPTVLSLTYDGSVDPASLEDVHLTQVEAHAIVEAFVPLNAMLKQPFDDIVTPAAQSVASLLTSRRVLAALGMRTRAAQEAVAAARTASPPATAAAPPAAGVTRQSSASSVASVASTAAAAGSASADRADGAIVLTLVSSLVQHATQATLSVEARTACAMALAALCKEPACAATIALPPFRILSRIIVALGAESVSARAACLRRELVQLAATLLEVVPQTAAAAVAEGLQTQAHAIAFDAHTRGVDPAFDAVAARVSERLTAVATAGRA